MAELPRVAVFKFASCDGCQLSLLCLEDALLALAGEVELSYFLEARSQALPGPYDVALVEGSILTSHDIERLRTIRKDSKYLIAIGACATAGGIQALRNFNDVDSMIRMVYASPGYIKTLKDSTPISAHIGVDFELNGCPINKSQLLEVLTSLLLGRIPHLPAHSVCVECKTRGTTCVLVSQGKPCLGPVTHAGCGALCPAYNRGCFGCYGPMESPNPDSLVAVMKENRTHRDEMVRLLRGFTGYSDVFRAASEKVVQSPMSKVQSP